MALYTCIFGLCKNYSFKVHVQHLL